jgi:hypothetical protein
MRKMVTSAAAATPSAAPPERTWFRSVIAAGAVSLLCIGLVACSGSSTATSTPPAGAQVGPTTAPVGATSQTGNGAASPCALLTQAEAAAAVGQAINAGVEDVTLGTCSYASSDFAAGVDLTVGSWDSMAAAATSNGAKPTPISGVGDEALNLNGAGGPSLLYVRKGSTGFLLTMNGPNIDSLADHGLAKEEALAALILARL